MSNTIEIHLMPGTKISFIPCDSETQIAEISAQQGESEFFALGASPLRTLLTEELIAGELSDGSNSEFNVFPIGAAGQLVWNHLPTRLAVLATPPIQSAMFIIPAHSLEGVADVTICEWLIEHAESLKVTHHLEESPVTGVDYPALAPQCSSMPTWLQSRCAAFTLSDVQSQPDAIAIKAGLFQIYDELDRSHDFSQDCQGRGRHVAGDYWHGIMHRREPDYGNSKYWFRRVGDHPVFDKLGNHASKIFDECESSTANQWKRRVTSEGWDPYAFVDLCQACNAGNDSQLKFAAQQIQWLEMMLLLAQTYRDAT